MLNQALSRLIFWKYVQEIVDICNIYIYIYGVFLFSAFIKYIEHHDAQRIFALIFYVNVAYLYFNEIMYKFAEISQHVVDKMYATCCCPVVHGEVLSLDHQ